MIMMEAVSTKIGELLDVLDEDIRQLETALSTLDALRGLLIKRDDAALRELLGQIAHQADARASNDRRRDALKAQLADMLGCEDEPLTLSTLQAVLPADRRGALIERQRKLRNLVSELKREYRLTAILVSDCARFNRTLMRAVFRLDGKDTLTYSASGTVRHRADTALMNLHF